MRFKFFSMLLMLMLFPMVMAPVLAQSQEVGDDHTTVPNHYYLTADDAGIQQVWQQVVNAETGEVQARQLTHAAADILTYGVAYDALAIAYVSDGQLWLQPIHTDEPEALATVQSVQFFNPPVFSPDGQYLAYGDQGVWLLDLSTRATRLILPDVPLAEQAANAAEFRLYNPLQFVVGSDGSVTHLIIQVGVWEWQSAGLYDLATDHLTELESHAHTSLLPLSSGQVLVYGNNGLDGTPELALADDVSSINQAQSVLDFLTLTDATLYADQAVEIQPGVVRIFGSALVLESPNDYGVFSFDYNVETGEASAINLRTLATEPASASVTVGKLSPDGRFIPVYSGLTYTDAGIPQGSVTVFDLMTGETVVLPLPEHLQLFQWQPE